MNIKYTFSSKKKRKTSLGGFEFINLNSDFKSIVAMKREHLLNELKISGGLPPYPSRKYGIGYRKLNGKHLITSYTHIT